MGSRRDRAIHREAEKIEQRMARALISAAERLRARLPIKELATADPRVAAAILSSLDIEDAYIPVAEIMKDAYMRGGKVTAKELSNV